MTENRGFLLCKLKHLVLSVAGAGVWEEKWVRGPRLSRVAASAPQSPCPAPLSSLLPAQASVEEGGHSACSLSRTFYSSFSALLPACCFTHAQQRGFVLAFRTSQEGHGKTSNGDMSSQTRWHGWCRCWLAPDCHMFFLWASHVKCTARSSWFVFVFTGMQQ